MIELFEVTIPWQGCQHDWADAQIYLKSLDATFTFCRQCAICGAEETRSVEEFDRLMGTHYATP